MWGGLHADEDRPLAVEGDARIRALRRKFDGGDILQPHEPAVLGLDDHALELIGIAQIGVGLDVGNDQIAFGLASGGLEIVRRDRRLHFIGRDVAPGHLHRIEPDPHRKSLPAENVGGGHAVDRRQHRLHHARQIIRDGGTRQFVAGKAEIHHGRGLAGGLGDDRVVGFLRDQIFDRVHLGEHLGERLVRVKIQLDVDLDRAGALHRRRGDVVDALGGGYRLLDRGRDKTLDQRRGRTGIRGGDVDHRVRQLWILPDREIRRRAKTDQQDQQADDDRQNRTLDEDIGKDHCWCLLIWGTVFSKNRCPPIGSCL